MEGCKIYYLCSDLNAALWLLENHPSPMISRNLQSGSCQIYRTAVYHYEAFTSKILPLYTLKFSRYREREVIF